MEEKGLPLVEKLQRLVLLQEQLIVLSQWWGEALRKLVGDGGGAREVEGE